MTDFNATAEYVRRHAERQRDIIALGEALKGIASIDQAAKERQEALDKLIEQHETRLAEIKTTEADHEAWLAQREAVLADHRESVRDITTSAKQVAADTILKAEITAQNTINAANTEVERIQNDHVQALKSLNEELATARAELNAANRDLDEVCAEHTKLLRTMEEMRGLAKAALGQ